MQINRQELLTALARVKPALAGKEVVEQSTAFAFLDDRVVTFNDEIAISHPFVSGLYGAVQAQELYKLLNKATDDVLDVEMVVGAEGGSELHVKGKRLKAGIRLHEEVRLPVDQITPPADWFPLPVDFEDGLSFCLPAACRDMTRPELTCVHFSTQVYEDGSHGAGMTACDNFKMAVYTLNGPWLADEVDQETWGGGILLPASSAADLLSYKPLDMSVVPGWIHFQNEEGTMYSARTMGLTYPEVQGFLNVEGVEVELPKELNDVLERASIFASGRFDQDTEVELVLENGWAVVKASGVGGWFEEKARCRYTGAAVTVRLHPDALSSIIGHVQKAIIGVNAMRFDGDSFIYAVSLAAGE